MDKNINHVNTDNLSKIIYLLREQEKTQQWLINKIKNIIRDNGTAVYSRLLKVFTHLDIPPIKAEKLWDNILNHHKQLCEKTNREMGLRVAMLDYFISVNKQIKNPKIIEIEIFEQLEKSVMLDDLTNLYNKKYFFETFEREIQRARRYGTDLSVVFLDVDDFKKCNDNFGHMTGDKILKKIAYILKKIFRDVDVICRYGGDEYVIILPETSGGQSLVATERLLKEIRKKISIAGNKIYITASIGISSFGIDGNSTEELVENADTALYRAKNDGKNRAYLFYTEKRKFSRINAGWSIEYKIIGKDKSKKAKTKDIGSGGLLFEQKMPAEIGALIEISFTPPFKNKRIINAKAKIVRIESNDSGTYSIGIYFTEIIPKDQKFLKKNIEKK